MCERKDTQISAVICVCVCVCVCDAHVSSCLWIWKDWFLDAVLQLPRAPVGVVWMFELPGIIQPQDVSVAQQRWKSGDISIFFCHFLKPLWVETIRNVRARQRKYDVPRDSAAKPGRGFVLPGHSLQVNNVNNCGNFTQQKKKKPLMEEVKKVKR